MLNRLIKRLQQLTAKLNNFIKWGLSKSKLIGVVFAITRVENQIETVRQEEVKMTTVKRTEKQLKAWQIERDYYCPYDIGNFKTLPVEKTKIRVIGELVWGSHTAKIDFIYDINEGGSYAYTGDNSGCKFEVPGGFVHPNDLIKFLKA